jgi:hypothetical protein
MRAVGVRESVMGVILRRRRRILAFVGATEVATGFAAMLKLTHARN